MTQSQIFENDSQNRRFARWGLLPLIVLVGIVLVQFWSHGPVFVALPDSVQQIESEVGSSIVQLPELPARLVIPAIGVDASVQSVGLTADGKEMDVPSNFTDVGWYEYGVMPGMSGSAVIAGHLNGKDIPKAVFYDLHRLQIGDEVIVMGAEQAEDIFVVTKIETYHYTDVTTDVFVSRDGKARLNLITCGGEWLIDEALYDTRTVVFTEQVTYVQ